VSDWCPDVPAEVKAELLKTVSRTNWGNVVRQLQDPFVDAFDDVLNGLFYLAKEVWKCLHTGGGSSCYEYWRLGFIKIFQDVVERGASAKEGEGEKTPVEVMVERVVGFLDRLDLALRASAALCATYLVSVAITEFKHPGKYDEMVEKGIFPQPET